MNAWQVPALIIFLVIAGITSYTSYARWKFNELFQADVNRSLANLPTGSEILDDTDLVSLPPIVAQYIRRSGAVGKPIPKSFRVEMTGKLRASAKDPWMDFSADQYSFRDQTTRLFFMNAKMKGLPVAGYHRFQEGKAIMDIRLLSMVKVQYAEGPVMDQSETVTFFNDLSIMAPSMLTDKRITWDEADEHQVKASFSANGITVHATLIFNEEGDLVDWISDDRYAYNGKGTARKLRWRTPLSDYRTLNGVRIAGRGEAIWEAPEGEYAYGIFNLNRVSYQ